MTFDFQGTSVITPIIPLLFVLVPAVYLASNSTENILETNSLRFIMTFGLIGSKITNKLIVSNTNFKKWNVFRESFIVVYNTYKFNVVYLSTFRSLK